MSPPYETTSQRLAREARLKLLIEEARKRVELARRDIPPPPILLTPEPVSAPVFVPSTEPEYDLGEQPKLVEGEHLSRESAKTKAEDLTLNEGQLLTLEHFRKRQSFVLIGAAGTGKTTITRIGIDVLQKEGLVGPLLSSSKQLQAGQPGIVVVSYTNKAVANIKRGLPKNIACCTIHKLLEFIPEFYEVQNADGEWVKTMRFEPSRTRFNPLPSSLRLVIIEESSMCSVELYKQLTDALPHNPAIIFLGDIQQLPPIYGQAILGFKLLELPVVELTEVFRQALESPIIRFLWKILDGKPLPIKEIQSFDTPGKFKIRPWKKKLSEFDATHVACLLMGSFIDSGEYNYLEDMILIPFNKGLGTLELNKYIANKLGKMRNAEVHEVIAGFQKLYFAIGDKVLVNKQEAIIEKISRNALYTGKQPLSPSTHLDRWGHYQFESADEAKEKIAESEMSLEELEELMASAQMDSGEIDDKKNQASHVLHCRMLDDDEEVDISTTGEFAQTLFAYALTVHKAQGSEWKRVIFLLHQSHATMVSRELLYTGCSRARESLYIICEPEHFQKGILRQRIKGNTLAEKAEFFKGKLEDLLNEEKENGNGKD